MSDTPLEAAARATWNEDHATSWAFASRLQKQDYRDRARAALTAAIEALPRQ